MAESGAVRQRRYRATDRGRATDARTNARRIFVNDTYLGTENRYPAPRDAVVQFARGLIERHREGVA